LQGVIKGHSSYVLVGSTLYVLGSYEPDHEVFLEPSRREIDYLATIPS
jgi:hypothetical protein